MSFESLRVLQRLLGILTFYAVSWGGPSKQFPESRIIKHSTAQYDDARGIPELQGFALSDIGGLSFESPEGLDTLRPIHGVAVVPLNLRGILMIIGLSQVFVDPLISSKAGESLNTILNPKP